MKGNDGFFGVFIKEAIVLTNVLNELMKEKNDDRIEKICPKEALFVITY
jgi:hypothetical protein